MHDYAAEVLQKMRVIGRSRHSWGGFSEKAPARKEGHELFKRYVDFVCREKVRVTSW